MEVPISAAKAQLTDLVRRAEAGDDVVLTRHGQPAVRLVPVATKPDRAAKKALLEFRPGQRVRSHARAERRTQPGFSLRRRRPSTVITVDTSALMAIVLDEPPAAACAKVLHDETNLRISAATVTEAMIVASRRGRRDAMAALLAGLGLDVVPVTAASGRRAATAYERWGKGVHPAALNFGDCFAYEVAAAHGGRLLFIGDDFSRTDLTSVL